MGKPWPGPPGDGPRDRPRAFFGWIVTSAEARGRCEIEPDPGQAPEDSGHAPGAVGNNGTKSSKMEMS